MNWHHQTARLKFPCIVAVILSGWSAATDAAPIKFRMSGTIDVQFQVGPLPPGVYDGAPFEALLSYDLATPDSRPGDPKRGFYSTTSIEEEFLLIRAGMSKFRSDANLSFEVGNDRDIDDPMAIDGFPDDSFILSSVPFEGNFEHSNIAFMRFRFYDASRSAFASDALPTNLNPADFADPFTLGEPFIEVSTFQFDPRIHQFRFNAVVVSISVVPEPTTLCGWLVAVITFSNLPRTRRFHRRGFQ